MRNRTKKAFTLVEILIVVVILGILAAIVVPQFTNATQDAQGGNLKAQIKSVQNQIELYKARTNAYPTLVELNANASAAGSLDITHGWSVLIDQKYIKTAPRNPAAPNTATCQNWAVVAGLPGACPGGTDAGWVYDEASGTLSATYFNEDTQLVTPGVP
jgi:general secretion pathway protein G